MCALAAALPFTNLAFFGFREVDREVERFEARRFRVFFARGFEDREARFLRRVVPPPGQAFDGQPFIHDI